MAASNTNPYVHSAKHEKDGKKTPENVFHTRRGQKSSSRAVVPEREDFFSMAAVLRHFSHYFWYTIHFDDRRRQEFVKGSKYLSAFWLQNEGLAVLRADSYLVHTFSINRTGISFQTEATLQSATSCCEDRMFVIPRRKFSRSERKLRSPLCNLRIIGMCQCERLSEELIKWPSKNERWKQSAWEGDRARHISAVGYESKLLLIEFNSGWKPAGTNLGSGGVCIRGKEGQWW